jgi:exoribonuclease R
MLIPSIRTYQAAIDFAAIRAEMGLTEDFPEAVRAEARSVVSAGAAAAAASYPDRGDDRDIPFVTIDPNGSKDLDQAVHVESLDHDAFRVHYAIADVAAFVAPGGALDEESHRRGMTLYCPDTRIPLYPEELSEGASSLLPDVDRPAVLWTIDLDARGEPTAVDVRRTLVRSRQQFDYVTVQAQANVGDLHPSIALLPRVGRLRLQSARRRHAINLDLPESEVVRGADGRWTLTRRSILPVERYNAQISLLTGTCAAQMMLRGRVGILRTLPPPDAAQIAQLRRETSALGIPWPDDIPPGDVVSELDAAQPRLAAFIEDAIRLLRGAGYTTFDGEIPQQTLHGGLGAAYAHVTAPLRRLVDRFATEICLSLKAGRPVPSWVRTALPALPGEMEAANRRGKDLERACTQVVSEFLLAERVGEVLTGVTVQADAARHRATVLLDEPPVAVQTAADGLVEGSRAAVRLTSVDRAAHRVDIAVVS